MRTYRARSNEVVDQDGRQIAVIYPAACTTKDARAMAARCAEWMNHKARQKERLAATQAGSTSGTETEGGEKP